MTFKEAFELSGLSYSEFSRRYKIPYRTLMNWASGIRNCPQYVLDLLEYRIRHEQENTER